MNADARHFSEEDLWRHGHEVLTLVRKLTECIAQCEQHKGDKSHASFAELQRTIKALHDLLETRYIVPEEFYRQVEVPDGDEIPF